jgi:hypothetical protein
VSLKALRFLADISCTDLKPTSPIWLARTQTSFVVEAFQESHEMGNKLVIIVYTAKMKQPGIFDAAQR